MVRMYRSISWSQREHVTINMERPFGFCLLTVPMKLIQLNWSGRYLARFLKKCGGDQLGVKTEVDPNSVCPVQDALLINPEILWEKSKEWQSGKWTHFSSGSNYKLSHPVGMMTSSLMTWRKTATETSQPLWLVQSGKAEWRMIDTVYCKIKFTGWFTKQ